MYYILKIANHTCIGGTHYEKKISVFLVEETGVLKENHRPAASH
jgi:hypothetical protein